ncbi:hypothetical protein M422DRAFT_29605 [Sphaerobolus stellatus SS14]|uniref:Cytochrome P450 n=1 Tax=Sphaerobolus stellatus (strain SS14) TaxID=990650 RepID=A0A0C9W2V0_SPHS4|nr:hypothetical protein M422DRAFT_29605 [Sphaerobolus stellatus SS14]
MVFQQTSQFLFETRWALSGASGVLSHLLFNRIEPRNPFVISLILLGQPLLLQTLFAFTQELTFPTLFFQTFPLITIIHLLSLSLSVIIYRLSPFHPLAKYPGPVICKITKFWTYERIRKGDRHRYFQALHAQYGPFVRTGPNQLTIADAAAIPTVMSSRYFQKAERYGVLQNTRNLLSIRDIHDHAARRKYWDKGMNTHAVQGYSGFIVERVGKLLAVLEQRAAKEIIDLAAIMSCLSFDVMGDFAFGGAFNLLEEGDKQGYARLIERSLGLQEEIGAIPWASRFIMMASSLNVDQDVQAIRKFSFETIKSRVEKGGKCRDLIYYLIDEDKEDGSALPLPTLIMEASLAIAAGSDTTSTMMSNMWYYLLSNPSAYKKLQREIDSEFPPGVEISASPVLGDLGYLNAVINEALRLQPVLPSGTQRVLPKGNGPVMVAGQMIPEGTVVQIPAYTVHRDPKYFPNQPEAFRPERWLENNVNVQAFFPFSWGPGNCVGKNFAILEMRITLAAIIQRFNIEFAPGYNPAEWEANLKDRFVLAKDALPVRLTPRY